MKANPQLEDGYTRIAHELLEALLAAPLTGQEFRIVWAVVRKTYGWGKPMDRISMGQFEKLTGIPRNGCHRVMKGLVEKNIIIKDGSFWRPTYGMQKNYKKWKIQTTPQEEGTPQERGKVPPRRGVKVPPCRGDTIEKKETGQKIVDDPCVEVLNYLKEVTKSRLDTKAKTNIKCTLRLLSRGYTVEDIKLVIDHQREPDGGNRHITPQDHFKPKYFEGYLQKAKQWASDVEAVGKHGEGARWVLRHLNETCGRSFRESPANLEPITNWLTKGHNQNDLKMVIDHKWREWGEKEEMVKFVRPATLFGPKFPTYLEEAVEAESRPAEELEYMADGAGRT
jgi:phage replication O-like protein O